MSNVSFKTVVSGSLVLLLVVGSHAVAGGENDENPRVPFETIVQGIYATQRDSAQEVVRSQAEYERIWRRTQHRQSPDNTPPDVDFQEEIVIAVFMGRRNTGGYSIEIEEIRASERRATVYYRRYAPTRGELRTQALTSPFHLVRVPRLGRDIRFSRRN